MYGNSNDTFDSVILAGGFGSRLSPLTENIPKPMMPIGEKTAFEHTVSLLKKHGFSHTAVTLMYLPEKIEKTGDAGGTLVYMREENPLGSAGAVGKLYGSTKDILLVISADAVCNFDLAAAKEEFIKSGCIAGILLHRVKNVGEYGSVCVTDGIITEFREKPSVRDTLSDLINTGIYFLKKEALARIPKDTESDFGKDIFPMLIRSGEKIAGIEPGGAWFDIGSFEELHRCNMFFTGNRNRMGARCSIHPSAKTERNVFFDSVTVGDSTVCGSIIGSGAVIGNGCVVPAGCVIGENAELQSGVSLAPGTVIGCNETVRAKKYFAAEGLETEFDDEAFTAAEDDSGWFVRLGNILGVFGERINVFSENHGGTLPRACELACGIAESGGDGTVISGGNACLASFAAYSSGYPVTAHITEAGGKYFVRLFGEDGMSLSREKLRKISGKQPKSTKKPDSKAGNVYLLPRGAIIKKYVEYLKSAVSIPKSIAVEDSENSVLLRDIAEELSVKSGGPVFSLSPDGTRASAVTESGREADYWTLLLATVTADGRKDMFLPYDTPLAAERIIKRSAMNIAFYGDSESDIRSFAAGDRIARDGILLAFTAKSLCEKNGITLDELISDLPPLSVRSRSVIADEKTMSATISALRAGKSERAAGFDFGDGRVNVFPSAKGRFRLIAEAADSETAEEITLKAIEMLFDKTGK